MIKTNYFINNKAFTLAEVLITLTIIGVIAAVTIPVIMNKVQNQETVSKVKKAYSMFSQAFLSLKNDDVDLNSAFSGTNSINALNTFATKLSLSKSCGASAGCWPNTTYKALDGSPWSNVDQLTDGKEAKAILTDGTCVSFVTLAAYALTNPMGTGPLTNVLGYIRFDINGFSAPNIVGKDYFSFWVTETGIYPGGLNNDGGSCQTKGDILKSLGCASKIIIEGAVNY